MVLLPVITGKISSNLYVNYSDDLLQKLLVIHLMFIGPCIVNQCQ